MTTSSGKKSFVLKNRLVHIYPIFFGFFGGLISFFLFLSDHQIIASIMVTITIVGAYLLFRIPTYMRIRILEDHEIFVRNGKDNFKINFKEILDFRFIHDLDSEAGITWAFEICTPQRDLRIGSEKDLETVQEFIDQLTMVMKSKVDNFFVSVINTRGDQLEFNERGLLINGKKVATVEYGRPASLIDPDSDRFIVDENSKVYPYDLDQRWAAYYIFLAKALGQIKVLFFWRDSFEMQSEK